MTASEKLLAPVPANKETRSSCTGRKKRIDRHTKNERIASAKKVAMTTSGSTRGLPRGSKTKSTKRGGGGSYNWGGTSQYELEFELDFEDYPEPHRDEARSAPQAKTLAKRDTGLDDATLAEALSLFGTWTGPAALSAHSPIFVPPESISALCEPISVVDAAELDAVDDFNDEMARLALLEVEMAKHIARAARKKEVAKRARAKAVKRANVTKLDAAVAKARARAGSAATGSPTSVSTSTLLSMMPSDPAPAIVNEGTKTTEGNHTELLLSRLRALLLVHELRTPSVVAAEKRNTAAKLVAAQAAHGRRRLAQEMVAQQHRRSGAVLKGDNRCWMQASRTPRRGAAIRA